MPDGRQVPDVSRLSYGCLRDLCFDGEEWAAANPANFAVLLPEFGAGVDGVRYTGYGFGVVVDKETLERMLYVSKEKTLKA